MSARRLLSLAATAVLVAGCHSPVEFEDWWLDSPEVHDPSLNDPDYRLSTRSSLTAADRDRPVIVAVHGFTASTYEWREFREFAEAESPVLVSLVLLGGHGRSLDDFAASTWRDWGAPILEEYEALVDQGYTNISFAAASTGATLVLEQLASGHYGGTAAPRHLFLVDPLVVPGDKNLSLIPLLRHLIGHVQNPGTDEEARHWYTNRPTAALAQLHELIGRVRTRLGRGITLPAGTDLLVYKTARDRTADPVGALLIHRGVDASGGGSAEVRMLDSGLHVFTRLAGRDPAAVNEADRRLQREAFEEMIERVSR